MQRPRSSQSPKRVGSGPSRPPISAGGIAAAVSASAGGIEGGRSSGVSITSESLPENRDKRCIHRLDIPPRAPMSYIMSIASAPSARLPHLGILRFSGADAHSFLQGQISNDTQQLA